MIPPRRAAIVLSYGIFDGIGAAETQALQLLTRLGDELIIGCATDRLCAAMGLAPRLGFEERRAQLSQCRLVARVIAQDSPAQHRTDIVNYNVDLLAIEAGTPGSFEHLRDIAQVVHLPRAGAPVPLTLAVA